MRIFFLKNRYYLLIISVVFFYSCENKILKPQHAEQTEKGYQVSTNQEIRKDFNLKSDWLPKDFQSNARVSGTNPEIYNIFGVGINSVDGRYKGSIIENRNSPDYMDIINRFAREESDQEYIVSSSYSEIDKNTSNKLALSLGIDTRVFNLDASLSVERQSGIQNKTSNLYVSIVRYRKYGYAQLIDTHSKINDYLTYASNQNNPSASCNVPNTQEWRFDAYGDRYVRGTHLGYMINATVQITNVDYQSSSKSVVEGAAKAAVRKVFDAEATWSDIQSSDLRFKESELIIRAKAIPSIDMIYSFDQLKQQISNLDEKFQREEFGTIAIETEPYSTIYPSCTFINAESYKLKKEKWQQAKLFLEGLRIAAISDNSLTSRINNEIDICNTNINKCLDLTGNIPDPGSYEDLYTEVLILISPCIVKNYKNPLSPSNQPANCPLYLDIVGSNGEIVGRASRINIDPEKMIPLYRAEGMYGEIYNSLTDGTNRQIAFYIYDHKYEDEMIPVTEWVHRWGTGRPLYFYKASETPPVTLHLYEKTVLGYIYPY